MNMTAFATAPALTRDDVVRLSREPSAERRSDVANKISQEYNRQEFNENELVIALQILRLLASDADLKVRRTLAEQLKFNSQLPRDIAMRLGRDVLEVALPILEFSPVLTDDDLVEILHSTREIARRLAISRREWLSPYVSRALVGSKEYEVVRMLAGNKGAALTDDIVLQILGEFAREESICEALIHRGDLSMGIVDKMMNLVSQRLQQVLVSRYSLPQQNLQPAIEEARDAVTFRLAHSENDDDHHMSDLVRRLRTTGRLTLSTIVRAMTLGDLRFLENAFAQLTEIPTANARKLLRDPIGFQAMYDRAELPKELFAHISKVLRIVIDVSQQERLTKSEYQQQIRTRIVASGLDEVLFHAIKTLDNGGTLH
ncbi:MAG: DUF2336 domain-containing protein [Alphaproteobacteria bacterium]|nr:DUF2336 domain-containing protein [Alphaproteobacteria bacterium]